MTLTDRRGAADVPVSYLSRAVGGAARLLLQSAQSRCGGGMVGMLAPMWMQERGVSAPGLLVLLTGSHVFDIAGRLRIHE